jgi:hypothetical protein
MENGEVAGPATDPTIRYSLIGGSEAARAAAEMREHPHERKELAYPAPAPPSGRERGRELGERLDQAAPPRAPPIRCKRKGNKGYGCRNNETAHPILLHGAGPCDPRRPRRSLPVPAHRRRWSDAAVHRHVRWSPSEAKGFAGELAGAATFLGDFVEISSGSKWNRELAGGTAKWRGVRPPCGGGPPVRQAIRRPAVRRGRTHRFRESASRSRRSRNCGSLRMRHPPVPR